MCTHKAQKYDFCTHHAHFSLIWPIWEPPMALIAKMVEKSIKICQIFFSRQYIIKRVRKRSFIKNVPKLAILTLSLQDMKNSLPLKMGTTVKKAMRNLHNMSSRQDFLSNDFLWLLEVFQPQFFESSLYYLYSSFTKTCSEERKRLNYT